MQKMLEELEARLSPVLGPSSPVLAKNPERERAFNKLGEIAMGFDATTKRLNSIMARIDL
jgi:hypothetical protein